jgi:hypothetical protein
VGRYTSSWHDASCRFVLFLYLHRGTMHHIVTQCVQSRFSSIFVLFFVISSIFVSFSSNLIPSIFWMLWLLKLLNLHKKILELTKYKLYRNSIYDALVWKLICHIVRNFSWTHISHRIMHARFCPFLIVWLKCLYKLYFNKNHIC